MRQVKSRGSLTDSVTDNAPEGAPAIDVHEGRGMGDRVTDRKTVSIPRACELVGVSRRTIYNWLASGKVQYIRTAGGSVRIYEDTLWREPGDRPGEQRSWPRGKSADPIATRGA